MGSKKAKKDGKPKSCTSPRKQKTARDAETEEESQEPELRDELPEGDAAAHGDGDGEKTEKVGTVWTPEQDEQIAAFYKDHTLFYDKANSEYKNKKKQENLILDLARTMFESGKCKFSFFNSFFPSVICCAILFIFLTFFVMNLLCNIDHYPNWFRQERL